LLLTLVNKMYNVVLYIFSFPSFFPVLGSTFSRTLFYFVGYRYYSMDMFPIWDAFSVWDNSVHCLQSAGETESEPPGYQTETGNVRGGLESWDWPRGREKVPNIWWSVLSHAETAQRLHTSSPANNKLSRFPRRSCPTHHQFYPLSGRELSVQW
jgi:hypothetical protein